MHHLLLSYKPDEEQHSAQKHVNVDIFRFSLHFSATNLENGYNILETKEPKLKGTKYVRECYTRKRLQLKKQQAQFWKLINEANDRMLDETTKLIHAWIPKEAVHLHLYYAGNWNKQT